MAAASLIRKCRQGECFSVAPNNLHSSLPLLLFLPPLASRAVVAEGLKGAVMIEVKGLKEGFNAEIKGLK